MSSKRITNPEFFGQLGQPLLMRLVEHFLDDFAAQGIQPPDASLEEKAYCWEMATLGMSKKGVPAKMADVLYGIFALGTEEGKDRLVHAASQLGILEKLGHTGTCEHFALQFYLASPVTPGVFEKKVHESQILARSSFFVFGSANPSPNGNGFSAPTAEQLRLFKADVDSWVAEAYRGQERATQIEAYETEDEHLLLIRIGDSSARQAVVEGDTFTYQHFRPARDLVVTYAPARDEVRINGKGSKKIKMLRETFGRRFFGDPDRFSVRDPFTLRPLLKLREEALEVSPDQGIDKITLTELVQETDGDPAVKMNLRGVDLFEFAEREKMQLFLPRCRLTGAGFDVTFTGDPVPRQFFLREGNGLRQARNSDVAALYRWMTDKGFRKVAATGEASDDSMGED